MRILYYAISALMLCAVSCTPPADHAHSLEVEAIEERLSASEGGKLVLRAINAAGGLQTWHDTPTSSFTWDFGSNTFLIKSHVVADNRTRRMYHDLLATGSRTDPIPLEGQMAWDGTDAWIYPDTLRINPRFHASTAYYFQLIPFVLADPGIRYEQLPDDSLDGTLHHLVKVSYDDHVGDSYGDTYVLYVNPESGQLRAIRYASTFGRGRPEPQNMREALLYYLDYQTIDGLTVPTRFERYTYRDNTKDELAGTALATAISFSEPFDEQRLVMPKGGRVVPFE